MVAKKYKRTYNPITRKYYKVEVLPDGSHKVIGLWSPKKGKGRNQFGICLAKK